MTYQVIPSNLALKQMRKFDREIWQKIISTNERIRIRPDAYVKKLVGDEGFGLRVGNYGVILDLNWEKMIILVLRIGHRWGIYNS